MVLILNDEYIKGIRMRRKLMAVLVASTGFAAGAQADTYTCHLNVNSRARGYISDKITFSISDGNQRARVSDAISLATNGRAVPAVLTINTNKRLSIKWALYDVIGPRNKRVDKLDYKLSLWMSLGNKVSVIAKSYVGANEALTTPLEVSSAGKCRLQK